ncbi:MAG: cation-transporting P-type ATPase [Candidatus Moranbacteria bacterium]|nr:cation-transporting P-type ATPase [Candidatus Moranbacteria bacterium]
MQKHTSALGGKNKKQIYNLSPEEVLKKFGSNQDGLNEDEAKKKLQEFGENKIAKKQNWKWLRLILAQFNDALVWILLVAAGLALVFAEYRDATIIGIIIMLNATVGFFQEFKADRVLESIKKLTASFALVFRSGEKKQLDTKLIVPGDVIFIAAGDSIAADGYLLESYDLKVNSFIFTGESKPKRKEAKVLEENNVAFTDIDNMVFMGETVATGEARFLVTGTGMNTELGRIAHLTQEVETDLTPLQKQMRTLGRDVTIISVFIGIVVLIAGQYFKMSLYQNFLFALALGVSVVPEGLPAAISVALSFGMKRLIKENVLAKKLNAVETLGSVSMICTDKTGTITRNELAVTKIVINGEILEIDGAGYEPIGNFYREKEKIDQKGVANLELLFRVGTLCNDASLAKDGSKYKIIGDPTEGAIIVAGQKYNKTKRFYERGEKKINENPFSSERMRMSVIYSSPTTFLCNSWSSSGVASEKVVGDKNSKTISYVKGSPDVMIDLCNFIKIGESILPFNEEEKNKARAMYNQMSGEALRVLAFAYRDLGGFAENKYLVEAEKGLVWVGMMAMIDPPRANVGNAIAECRNLGIGVVMITGDYEITARAIAENVGLIKHNLKLKSESDSGAPESDSDLSLVINGKTLDTLKDKELYQKIKNGACVFARIAPEQKLRIATVLKKYGEVIAMTGDGVNDAPALKKADIGVAMGIIGTDVSKEAASMILMDDNFASIVKGVRTGRTIFQNLKKFVHYVFTANAGELFTVIFGVLLHIPSPISAIQILAIDLGTDIFPSFALGLEPEEPGVSKLDLNSRGSIMSLGGFRRIIYLGIIMATGAVAAFLWSMLRGGWHFGHSFSADGILYLKSTTAAYAVLSMTQMANLLQARSEKLSPFQLGFFKNKYAIGAIGISMAILCMFMYVPFFQVYLHMLPIDWMDWLVVAGSFLAVFLWEEVRKEELQKS